jgi:3-oxoadipate enol-lactonase
MTSSFYYLDPNPTGQPAVLLLHGLGVDGSSWEFQIRALIDAGMRPIAPDLPGFGKSRAPEGRWNLRNVSAMVVEFLDQLRIERCSVVGISMGGIFALWLGVNESQRIDRLVLVNTFACLRPIDLSDTRYLGRRFLIANLRGSEYQAEQVAWRIFPQEDQAQLRVELVERIMTSNRGVYKQAMRTLAVVDFRRKLKNIRIPTLLISGECDTTIPLKKQRVLAEGIPRAQQVVIGGAGHAVIADHPREFNQTLLSFLEEGIPVDSPTHRDQ